MVIIETVLGNISDPEWTKRLSTAHVDLLEVDQWEVQKSRFRKTTAKGAELAISLDRGTYIRDGDVLFWDAKAAEAIVARIDLRDVMVVYLDDLTRLAPEIAMRSCVELGHAMGNQHWPALVKGNLVYVPLTVDRKLMASVMNTHHFEGIRYDFVPGREIVPYLAPHESRRLFGGAEGPVHRHTHESYGDAEADSGRVYGQPPVQPTCIPDPTVIHTYRRQHRFRDTTMADDGVGASGSATFFARMLQFGDSMFPIGAFSFSGGLESAIQKGVVTDAATLLAFTLTAVEQAERGDGIALIAAHRAAAAGDLDALIRIDEQVHVRKLSTEMRTMSVRMGKKFTEMGVQVIGAPLLCTWRDYIETSVTPGCYPVALAVTFAVLGLPALGAFAVHQYGVAATTLSAALRLMKISHVETQKILYELNGRVGAAYETAAAAGLSHMWGYAPLKEILAAVHTKAHVRLFMN
jgi:urease accessory protein UreF/urease accessory protein UreE